jgi:ssDNA-binding Zn-finger/Zn-ribbon topoisomerase 1
MKYEYIIEVECPNCGSIGRQFTGIMDNEKSKQELTSQFSGSGCPDCGQAFNIKKIKKQFIGKTKVENEVYI